MKSGLLTKLSCLFLAMLVSACGIPANMTTQDVTLEAYYKNTPEPPVGYGRIYILPSEFKNFLTGDNTIVSLYHISNDDSTGPRLAVIDTKHFVAFDVKSGPIKLTLKGNDDIAFCWAETVNITSGSSVVIQGKFKVNSGGLIQALAYSTYENYNVFQYSAQQDRIRSLAMASVSPASLSIVKQEIPSSVADVKLPAVIAPVTVVTPSVAPVNVTPGQSSHSSSDLDGFEKLKKLYDSGLITKDDYETKKKQLLDKIH